MAASLMEKLTNFLMPLEEEEEIAAAPVRQSKNPPQLTVHEGAARRGEEFSITVVVPRAYENVCSYADLLLQGKGLIVNFSCLTAEEQCSMADFLEGVRAQIIDKDRNPQWKYSLDTLPMAEVARLLAPLPAGCDIDFAA